MNLKKVTVNAGAVKPFKLLHITDNHLAFADKRDDARKLELADKRRKAFEGGSGRCEKFLDEAIAYAGANGELLVHTGDLIDFVSYKNLDTVKEKLAGIDYMMTAGNHEFSLYVGEAFEDEAYKAKSFAMVQAAFKNDINFSARVINGVNLIFIDDSYYLFSEKQLLLLKTELDKSYPAIIFLHNPLYTRELYDEKMKTEPCAYLTACPEALIKNYDEYRYRQQKADEITCETVGYIKRSSNVKAIFAGHLHTSHEGKLDCGIPQYVTGGAFAGYACEITVD